MRVMGILANRLSLKMSRRRLFIQQTNTLLGFLAFVLAVIFSLTSVFRFSSEALLALSGTIAVAGGFALKDVATSFMARLMILTNKPFQVGDRVNFGAYYGEIIEIGMRNVKMVTLDDNLVSIPTHKFLTEVVASANSGNLECMVVLDFYLGGGEDHQRASEIVRDAVLASNFFFLEKPVVVLLGTKLTIQGHVVTVITAKAYVFDTRYEKDFESDVTDRTLVAFRREGIRMAA